MRPIQRPSVSDLRRKRIQLGEKISSIKSEVDRVSQENKETSQVSSRLTDKINQLNLVISETDGLSGEVFSELENLIKEGESFVFYLKDLENNVKTMMKTADDAILSQAFKFKGLKEEHIKVHEKIIKEQKEIQRQKRDLDIYKNRLEKVAREIKPDFKIIL